MIGDAGEGFDYGVLWVNRIGNNIYLPFFPSLRTETLRRVRKWQNHKIGGGKGGRTQYRRIEGFEINGEFGGNIGGLKDLESDPKILAFI